MPDSSIAIYSRRASKLLIAIGLGLSVLAPSSWATGVRERVKDRLDALHGVPNVHLFRIGESRHASPIDAAIVTDPARPETFASRTRVLVISGQHGNEPTPVRANLELLDFLASGAMGPRFLDRFIVAIIPMVNPDGLASSRRCNSVGIDLNRDWQNRSQPETIAVRRFIDKFRPEVIVDLHEWTSDDPITPNCIEAPGYGQWPADRLSRLLVKQAVASQSPQSLQLKPILYTGEADSRLAHRALADEGFCTFLVETAPGPAVSTRIDAYTGFVVSVLSQLADPRNIPVRTEFSDLKTSIGKPAALAAMIIPPPKRVAAPPKPKFGGYWLAVAAGAVLMLAVSASRKRASASAVMSPRTKTLTDIVASDLPVRQRAEMIRRHRTRPSDRAA